MKKILIEILQELKSINKKLQAIESSKEQYESIQKSISKKADKEHIIEQINSSLEDYRIDGKKIHVNSDSLIDKDSIKDESIQNISGEKVLVNSLSEISTTLGKITF